MDQDLDNLVLWGNLTRQQEMVRPKSIEEYRNKHFRYQISEDGIIVEEMVFSLINIRQAAQGSLDEKEFFSLLNNLQAVLDAPEDKLTAYWQNIREDFKKIQTNTSNYIGYITSPEVDSRMKTEQFLIYKDKFVNYLRDFISTVQHLYYQLSDTIKKMRQKDQTALIEALFQEESAKPSFEEVSYQEIKEQFEGELQALFLWFIPVEDRQSEYDSLMAQTEQMITKITGLIYFFGQEMRQYRSRKKDYLHIAEWFADTEELDRAKEMYAAIFGLEHTRHFHVPAVSDATGTREDSWELPPGVLLLNNRGKGVRLERKASSFTLKTSEQQKQLDDYLEKENAKKEKIESYFKNGDLTFSELQGLDAASRKIFLRWISLSMANRTEKIEASAELVNEFSTEMDFKLEIQINLAKRIMVESEDGTLEMPEVIMRKRQKDGT